MTFRMLKEYFWQKQNSRFKLGMIVFLVLFFVGLVFVPLNKTVYCSCLFLMLLISIWLGMSYKID